MIDWRTNWRATSYRLMFGKLDGVLALILFFFLVIFLFFSLFGIVLWELIVLSLFLTIFFMWLSRKGYPFPIFWNLIIFKLVGKRSRGGKRARYRME